MSKKEVLRVVPSLGEFAHLSVNGSSYVLTQSGAEVPKEDALCLIAQGNAVLQRFDLKGKPLEVGITQEELVNEIGKRKSYSSPVLFQAPPEDKPSAGGVVRDVNPEMAKRLEESEKASANMTKLVESQAAQLAKQDEALAKQAETLAKMEEALAKLSAPPVEQKV